MKKQLKIVFISALLIVVALQSTIPCSNAFDISLDPASEPLKLGDTFEWEGSVFTSFELGSEVKIKGMTTSNWIIQLTPQFGGFPGSFVFEIPPTYTVPRNNSDGGFPILAGGNRWGLWIDLDDVTEGETVVVSGELVGVPNLMGLEAFMDNFFLQGPFSFEVRSGVVETADGKIYEVWIYEEETADAYIYLFYEKNFGLLVRGDFLMKVAEIYPIPIPNYLNLIGASRSPPIYNPALLTAFQPEFFGADAIWSLMAYYMGTSMALGQLRIEVYAESTKDIFLILYPEISMGYIPFTLTYIVKKAEYSTTPFSLTNKGDLWGLWINSSKAVEGTGPVLSLNMSIFMGLFATYLLDLVLLEPFQFDSYEGNMISPLTGKSVNTWCFDNGAHVGGDYYMTFQKSTGLLLRASYNLSYSGMGINITQVLTSYTGPSGGIPGFSISVAILGILGIISVVYLKNRAPNRKLRILKYI